MDNELFFGGYCPYYSGTISFDIVGTQPYTIPLPSFELIQGRLLTVTTKKGFCIFSFKKCCQTNTEPPWK